MKTNIKKMKTGSILIILLFALMFTLFPSYGMGAVGGQAVMDGGVSQGGGGYGLFLNAFIIILREGFEAILVISALVAYLTRSGNREKVRTVYMGGVWALVASIITAYILSTVIVLGEEGQEALEGVTMLLATAVLFYVSYWLITKSEVTRWQGYIKSKVDSSIGKGSAWALGLASFMAVYREGAETALFYLALFSTSQGSMGPAIAGFATGSLILVIIFLLFKYGEMRLPIGPFFAVTSTLLYYLAFVFAGKGIHALQEAEWISETYWEAIPRVSFFGIYPTFEGIALQAALIGAMLIAVIYSLLIKPYREKLALERDISHIGIDITSLHDLLDDVNGHTMEIAKWAKDSNVEEVQSHIRELDRKVHEIMDHLATLEKETKDTFIETEKEIGQK